MIPKGRNWFSDKIMLEQSGTGAESSNLIRLH
jgi:hypothetical protein